MSFWDSVAQQNEQRVFDLNLNGCIIDDSYHKMCIKKVIENSSLPIDQSYLDPKIKNAPSIHTKLAVAYQVLSSEHTAFICVIQENHNGQYLASKNVIQPTLESIDYGN